MLSYNLIIIIIINFIHTCTLYKNTVDLYHTLAYIVGPSGIPQCTHPIGIPPLSHDFNLYKHTPGKQSHEHW